MTEQYIFSSCFEIEINCLLTLVYLHQNFKTFILARFLYKKKMPINLCSFFLLLSLPCFCIAIRETSALGKIFVPDCRYTRT